MQSSLIIVALRLSPDPPTEESSGCPRATWSKRARIDRANDLDSPLLTIYLSNGTGNATSSSSTADLLNAGLVSDCALPYGLSSTTVIHSHCAFPNFAPEDGHGWSWPARMVSTASRRPPGRTVSCRVGGSGDMVGFEGYLIVPYGVRLPYSTIRPWGVKSLTSQSGIHVETPR